MKVFSSEYSIIFFLEIPLWHFQALYLLMQCGSVEDALKKKDDQSKLPSDATPWSGEECRNFELGEALFHHLKLLSYFLRNI